MADEDVKTLAVKLAMEDSTFTAGIKNLRQQLGVVNSEFAAAGGAVKGFGETLDGVKANAQALGDKIKTQKDIISQYQGKVEETRATLQQQAEAMIKSKAAMEAAAAAYQQNLEELGKNDEATKASKEALDEQTEAFKRSEAQVRKTQSSLNGYTIQANKATGELKSMETELANNNAFAVVGKNLEDTGTKLENVGGKMNSVGQSLTWGLSLPIAAAGVASVKMATDFETSSAKVSTIADSTVMSLDKMKSAALELSTETGADVNDINQALYQAMSAGIKTSDSIKFVGDAVKLAKGGFTDTTTAIDTLTSVLNAYHMKASEANEISDQLVKTQDLGKTTVGELGQSLGQVIPIAASLNVKTQDLFGSIAELTKNGMPADEAITAIKGSLSAILKPTSDASKAAKQMGLDFSAAHLQNVGFAEFINEIAKATGGNAQKMSELFKNVRALNGMMVLAGSSNQDFNSTLKDMASASGATNDAFEKVEDSGAAKLEKAINAIKNDGIEAGEKLMPAVVGVADDVAKLADAFSKLSPQTQTTILKIAAITAAIGPAALSLGTLTKGVGALVKVFGGAIGGIGNFVKGLSGISIAGGEAVPAAMRLGGTLAGLINPATLTAAAVAGVGTAIATVYLTTANAKKPIDGFVEALQNENTAWGNLKDKQDAQAQSDMNEILRTQALWGELQGLVDVNGKVAGSKERVRQITDTINKTAGKDELKLVGDVVQGYRDQKQAIDDMIQSKKAEILIEAKEPEYKQALTDKDKLLQQQGQLSVEIDQQELKVKKSQLGMSGQLQFVKDAELKNEQDRLKKMTQTYSDNQARYEDYVGTIKHYEDAMAANSQGDYGKVQQVLDDTGLKYDQYTSKSKQQLSDNVDAEKRALEIIINERQNGNQDITDDDINAQRTRYLAALAAYQNEEGAAYNGANQTGLQYANGLNSQDGNVYGAGANVANNAQSGMSSGNPYGVGSSMGNSLANGVNSQSNTVYNSGLTLGEKLEIAAGSFNAYGKGSSLARQFSSGWESSIQLSLPQISSLPAGSVFARFGHNAGGTDDWRGGLTYVNEQGGELMNLPQHTQIIPHDISMEMAKSVGENMVKLAALIKSPDVIVNNNQAGNTSSQTNHSSTFNVTVHIHTTQPVKTQDGSKIASVISNELARQISRKK